MQKIRELHQNVFLLISMHEKKNQYPLYGCRKKSFSGEMPPERNKSGVDVVLKISLQHEYSDLNRDVVTQNLLKLFSLANLHQLVEETLWSKSKLNSLLVGLNLMISLWHENSQNWRKFNHTSITCGWIWRSFNISKKGLSDTQKSWAIISWILTKHQKKLSQRFLW